jgi:hypothetical protein
VLAPFAGVPVRLESRIKEQVCWEGSETRSGSGVYRVVYFDDPDRDLQRKAIQIDVVQGQNTGWHGAVDAHPFGFWLGVPIGIALIVVGGIGMLKNRSVTRGASSQITKSPGPLKDSESELTDLKL